MSYLICIVFNITSTECHQHIEPALTHDVAYFVLGAELLLDARTQIVVDKTTGHAWDGLLACRVDIHNSHIIEQRQRIGEIAVEIAGAGIEMGLQDDEHSRSDRP